LEVEHFDVLIVVNVYGDQTFHPKFFDVCNTLSTIDDEFVLDEIFSKSLFLEVNEKKFDNITKVNNHRATKHMVVHVKNAFDEW
jgi:hypothetical protein